jgi:hypothetical protein
VWLIGYAAAMSQAQRSEYLVLSRGQWDREAPPEKIEAAIETFYVWHDRLVAEGRMRAGFRLTPDGRTVSRNAVTDGPYAESKELVGGYWFIIAASLDEAARIVADNPCLAYGLVNEVRPLEPGRASVYVASCETPRA